MRFIPVWVVILLSSCCLSAQAIGGAAPEKVFINQWGTPSGVSQLSDFKSLGVDGTVVLLDWWGAS